MALEALTTDSELRARVPLVVTFGTPYDGAQVATIGRAVLNNPALADMAPRDGSNSFLTSLTNRWKRSRSSGEPATMVLCAYENVPLPGIGLVVPETSASSLCDDVADPIAEDHIGIIKPDGPEHQSIKVLTNALRLLPTLASKTSTAADVIDSGASQKSQPESSPSSEATPPLPSEAKQDAQAPRPYTPRTQPPVPIPDPAPATPAMVPIIISARLQDQATVLKAEVLVGSPNQRRVAFDLSTSNTTDRTEIRAPAGVYDYAIRGEVGFSYASFPLSCGGQGRIGVGEGARFVVVVKDVSFGLGRCQMVLIQQ